jgi:hypothetical protein
VEVDAPADDQRLQEVSFELLDGDHHGMTAARRPALR